MGLPESWSPYVSGEMEVVMVPGAHATLVNEPHTRGVATAVQADRPVLISPLKPEPRVSTG